MKKLNDAFLRMNPDEEQRARMLEKIQQSAMPARRLPLKKILALAAAAALCAATIVFAAVPAVKTYFVPHLGVVEVPETREEEKQPIPYMLLKAQTGAVSGSEYRVGYLYGDTAVVYVNIPTSEEYRTERKKYTGKAPGEMDLKAYAALIDGEKARIAELESDSLELKWYRTYADYHEYRLTFRNLDAGAASEGIFFLGDTIHFTAAGIEYTPMAREHHGVTFTLIPLSEDYTIFTYTLEVDERVGNAVHLDYDERSIAAGYSPFFTFIDADGHRFSAKMQGDLIYLEEKPCEAPIVQLFAKRLKVRISVGETIVSLPMPAAGETSQVTVETPYTKGWGTDTMTVSVKNGANEPDSSFPNGYIRMWTNAAVSAEEEIRYTAVPFSAGKLSDLLDELQKREGSFRVRASDNARSVPYVDGIGDTVEVRFSTLFATYTCDWSFTFD